MGKINKDNGVSNAVAIVKDKFPFPGIYSSERYLNIVSNGISVLNENSEILDLGAGACEIPAIMSLLGQRCVAFDDFQDEWLNQNENREKVFNFAKDMDVEIAISDLKTWPFEKNRFDMFMMHDVLEHIHDSPCQLLNDGIESVKPGGYFFTTVPSVVNIRKRTSVLLGRTNLPDYQTYYWYPGKWRGPVREYTKGDLSKMCEFLGLKIIKLEGCHHMLDRVPRSILPFYKLATSVFSDWRDSWLLLAQKPKDWSPRRSISESEFEEIIKGTQKKHRRHKKII